MRVFGRAVEDVIGSRPHASRQSQPESPRRLLAELAIRHIRVIVGELPQHPPVAQLVLHHEHEVDMMPTPRQLADRRGEVAKRAGVAHGEENLHLRLEIWSSAEFVQSLSIEPDSSRLKNQMPVT